METFDINIKDAAIGNVTLEKIENLRSEADKALQTVLEASGAGNDFLGWVNLPSATIGSDLVDEINSVANVLRAECEAVVCIGIGGSYLGAKAVIEAMKNQFAPTKPEILFAGHNIGEDYLAELMDYLADKRFGIIVISKSGTTTEPAIAFRLLRSMLERKVGREEAAKLTVAITDAKRGALRSLATDEGYATFIIDDNVGGRFSVLSPVGLLPIAVAGFNIRGLLQGAADMEQICSKPGNPAQLYAMTRNALYRDGKKTEILVNYNPKLHFFAEWWKQLYGESEGKDHKGIFPAAVDNSTDLHSMGQWIQDGERTIFETVISVENQHREVIIPNDEANLDGLNFIAGQHVDRVNKMAELGTRLAHIDGGVPNLCITISEINEYNLGQLIYFFEIACGISGYMLEVNPFNQPGVEAYKKNMFALLAKPGYEAETAAIRARLEK